MQLLIKILPLNEHGKTHDIPCRIEPQIEIKLDKFIKEVLRLPDDYSNRRNTIRFLLDREYKQFECPIGWQIKTATGRTKEYVYYPPRNQNAIDFQLYPDFSPAVPQKK